jgi:putative oxidoreductase
MAIFDTLGKYRNTGLLVLRIGVGAMMMVHGLPKIMGGPDKWTALGGSMNVIGINFLPLFWGLMAALAEGMGGFLIILGLFFRPVNMMLAFTMLIAALVHFAKGDGWGGASHAIELGFVFLSLIFIGPGRYSVDKK